MGGYEPARDIAIVAPDPAWPGVFAVLASQIRAALGDRALGIEHVGSTSVPLLPAKPIIDIDLTVADSADEESYVPALEAVGFVLRVREPWWYEHRCLVMDEPGCNLHVFSPDNPEAARHRIFRDQPDGGCRRSTRLRRGEGRRGREANANGEHVMEYNARKQAVIRQIYARAFRACGSDRVTARGRIRR